MRALLTKTVRPRLGQSQLNLSHGSNIPTRRTAIPPIRRKLTASDAFAILLAPVLTAAFVADITCKDRKRQEWDRKLAQVLQEIELLREKELQSWSVLQLSSISVGVANQRRAFSTSVVSRNMQNNFFPIDSEFQNHNTSEVGSEPVHDVDSEPKPDLQRYESLLARKVGLQLLLYISTGRKPVTRLEMEGVSDGTVTLDSMDDLLRYLRRVNQRLYELEKDIAKQTTKIHLDVQTSEVDEEISSLTWQCRSGAITIPDLVYGYTRAVLKCNTGIALATYRNLVETFSTLDADVLTSIAMMPYLRTKQILSDRTVVSIIYQYGKIKDPRRLEKFLGRLTQSDRGFHIETAWHHVLINGVRVPTPVENRPRILDILVRVALQGDQPHKARAWATLFTSDPASVGRFADLFNSFLTYCARHVNWADGQFWLQRTIIWIAVLARNSPWTIQRIIFRTLDLCIACNQPRQYDAILDAAVTAGINVPAIDPTRPDAIGDQARQILSDWTVRIKQNEARLRKVDQYLEAATSFQNELAKLDSALNPFVGLTDVVKMNRLLAEHQVSDPAEDLNSTSPKALFAIDGPGQGPVTTHELTDNVLTQQRASQISANNQVWAEQNQSLSQWLKSWMFPESEKDEAMYQGENQRMEYFGAFEADLASHENLRHGIYDMSTMTDNLPESQYQNQPFPERVAQLETQMNIMRVSNMKLLAKVQESNEKKLYLDRLTKQLELELKAVSRKSLETVFLEKENLKINLEIQALKKQYQALLKEKNGLQVDFDRMRKDHARREKGLAADFENLTKDNQQLQNERASIQAVYDKFVLSSKAREMHWHRSWHAKETALRKELATLKSTGPR